MFPPEPCPILSRAAIGCHHPILLENVLYELFKNSLRAVHEFHAPGAALPDVVVKICAGEVCCPLGMPCPCKKACPKMTQ